MTPFRVLFVDDERGQFEAVEHTCGDIENLDLVYAADQDAALAAIDEGFFHLAIVDVSLRGQAMADTDGLFILKRIRAVRPSCERLLLTTMDTEHRPEALKALAPGIGKKEALAHGYVDKVDQELRAGDVIRDRAKQWLRHPVEIVGAAHIYDHLLERRVAGRELSRSHGPVRPTHVEVDSVLARLFGQGRQIDVNGMVSVDHVELEPISESWSTSVTQLGSPQTRGRPGPTCVVKVGPRDDAQSEAERYRSFVRYGLAQQHRVELLTSVLGDTIGAVCYTHFEPGSGLQTDLQHLLDASDPRAIRAIQNLFDSSSQFWFADQRDGFDLGKFMFSEYGKKFRTLAKRIKEFASSEPGFAIADEGRTLRWDGTDVGLPTIQDLSSAHFGGPYKACVVHGDLHGGNVLVTDDARPVLIDYRNMTLGPRVLDLASLDVSARMTRSAVGDLDRSDPAELVAAERDSWQRSWVDRSGTLVDSPFWAQVSAHLAILAQQNFVDVTQHEYARIALLRALRVMAARAPQPEHRRRLVPYIGVLVEVVREAEP